MTLADRLIEHCRPENTSNGFGALMEASFPLRDLLAMRVSQRLRIADGVELSIPEGCNWKTGDMADGSVLMTFTENPPVVTVTKGIIKVQPNITSLVLRLGAAAAEAQANLRLGFVSVPPYTLRVPLGGRRAE